VDEIESSLKSDKLSPELLKAYEKRAISKLIDFEEYINFLSDKNLNSKIRNELFISIYDLFEKGSTGVTKKLNPKALDFTHISINEFIEKFSEIEKEGAHPKFENIRISEPFKNSDSGYSCKLAFDVENILKKTDQSTMKDSEYNILVKVNKVNKQIGEEKLISWKVFLGNIELKM
jgi:hypothetical protein